MGLKYVDRVKETTQSTGVGPTFLLDGPVAKGGYRGFVDKIGNGQQCAIMIEDLDRDEWAIFQARIIQGSPNDSIEAIYLSSSSNDDALVNFQPGEKFVSCINAGEDISNYSTLAKSISDGGDVTYDATFGFVLSSGNCSIEGFRISWQDINGPGPSGHAASKMHYLYIHDDNEDGVGSLEFDVTAPAYNAVDRYLQKSGDPSRRLVNAVMVNAAGQIPRFYSEKRGGHIWMTYGAPTADAELFSGSVPLVWTELTALLNYVPVGATGWHGRIVANLPSQNNTLTVSLDAENVAGRGINDAKALISFTAPKSAFLPAGDFVPVITSWAQPTGWMIAEEVGINTAQISVRGWEMDV